MEDTESFRKIAKRVADYIENGQERLENGMFYREREDSLIDYKTIWADDLYMSVPFLCRYYKLTGEDKYLEDAVNQILCFRDKLYMPEVGCMSHVYNLIYDKKTCVPWGRGNGWPTVALTELLEVLPKEHKAYGKIQQIKSHKCRVSAPAIYALCNKRCFLFRNAYPPTGFHGNRCQGKEKYTDNTYNDSNNSNPCCEELFYQKNTTYTDNAGQYGCTTHNTFY